MSIYTPHDHPERVEGCFRCDLSHDETARSQVEALAAATGQTVDEVERSAAALVEALTGDNATAAPTPQPDAERVEGGEVNQGVGWYEFITPKATTRIAYVGESGGLYLPEGDPEEHFHLASAEGRAHRLIRADALDVEEMARAADPKAFEDHPIELRSRPAALQWAVRRKIATDHARAIRTALLGSAS